MSSLELSLISGILPQKANQGLMALHGILFYLGS